MRNVVRVVIQVSFLVSLASHSMAKVRNLTGKADFRSVTLLWDRQSRPPTDTDDLDVAGRGKTEGEENDKEVISFRVRFCENQSWGPDQCRFFRTSPTTLVKVADDGVGGHETYSFEVKGLRMATTYIISVEEETPVDRAGIVPREQRHYDNSIVVTTKGFSARATACNATTTMIHLDTGPYFGGRISIEGKHPNTSSSDCSFQGDPSSPNTSVMFTIDHDQCDGVIRDKKGTGVKIFVVVQESLPIMTHSTRRFLVLCNFKPTAFTVKAGLNMPPSELKRITDVLSFKSNRITGPEGRSMVESGPIRIKVPRKRIRQPKNRLYYKNYPDSVAAKPRNGVLLTSKDYIITTSSNSDDETTTTTTTTIPTTTKQTQTQSLAGSSTKTMNTVDDRKRLLLRISDAWYPVTTTSTTSGSPKDMHRHPKSYQMMTDDPSSANDQLMPIFPSVTLAPGKERAHAIRHPADDGVPEEIEQAQGRTLHASDSEELKDFLDLAMIKAEDRDVKAEKTEFDTSSGLKWLTVPEEYEYPVSHIVLMIILVISAIVGSIATVYWSIRTCKQRQIAKPQDESGRLSPSMPRLRSMRAANSTICRSHRNSRLEAKTDPQGNCNP